MRVALYPRVSGHLQEENYSIPEQIQRMQQYCLAKEWTVYKTYTDSGFSGGGLDRPGLQAMIADIEAGKIDMVLVYKLDRLSRSQKDTLYLIEDVFEANGVAFTSMTENFDTSTPFGKAILGVLSVFAELERSRIRERTMMGQEARALEGKHHGGRWIAIGYDLNDEGELVVNEYEKMQLHFAAEKILAAGPSAQLRTICDEMNAKGFRHKGAQGGDGTWNPKTLKRALSNPAIIGKSKYKDTYVEGIHDPIMNYTMFADLQLIFSQRGEMYGTKYKAHKSLLGGIIYCTHCGAKYTRTANGAGKAWYACYSRCKKGGPKMVKDPNCKNIYHRTEELDSFIIDEIKKMSLSPEYIEELRERKPVNDNAEKVKTIRSKIEGIDKQISKLMDLYAIGSMPIEMISGKVTELDKTKKALEAELDSLEIPKNKMSTQMIMDIASCLDENSTLEEQRAVVSKLIHHIDIDNDNVYIHCKF